MPALYDGKRRAKEHNGCILLSHTVSFPFSNDRIECMGRNVEREAAAKIRPREGESSAEERPACKGTSLENAEN